MKSVNSIIAQWKQAPFRRGSTDCCAFCNYVWSELTGESRLPEYDSDAGAEQIISAFGTLAAAVTHFTGRKLVAPDALVAGDITLVRVMDHDSIGILMEHGTVAVVFEQIGLREISFGFVDGGWPVGR